MPYYNLADAVTILTRTLFGPLLVGYLYRFTGLLMYATIFYLYYTLLKCFGFESLSTMDEFFFLDSKQNRSNVITVIKIDKVHNYYDFKQFLQSVALKCPRGQHRVVKFLGNYFF